MTKDCFTELPDIRIVDVSVTFHLIIVIRASIRVSILT